MGISIRTAANIAVGIASSGTVATAILAAKGGAKLATKLGDTTRKDILRAYGPPTATGALVLAAIGYLGFSTTDLSNKLLKEIAAHALTMAAERKALEALEKKGKELIGPKKTQLLKDEYVNAEQQAHAGPSGQTYVEETHEDGDTLCFDRFSARYFRSSAEFIRQCENLVNQDINHGAVITMDDIHEQLGLESTTVGHMFQNVQNELVRVQFTSTMTRGDCQCLNVDWVGMVIAPEFD